MFLKALLYTQLGYWYPQNVLITITGRPESAGDTLSDANSWELWVFTTSKERSSTVPWYIARVLFLASVHFLFELWGHICNFLIKNNLRAISSLQTYLKIVMRSPLNHHFDKFSRLNFWSLSLVVVPRLQAILETRLWIHLKVVYVLIKAYLIWRLIHIAVALMLYRKAIWLSGSYLVFAF